jgi:drug/metabolite transporter (DMT)-like permease
MAAAIVFALLAAMLFAAGSVLQQRAARSVPRAEARGLGLVGRLVRRPLWLVGTAADVLGFAAQAGALGFGSLLVVQPILATTLLFALPAAAAGSGRRLPLADWLWAILLTAGVAVFLQVGRPTEGADRAGLARWLLAGGVLLPIVACCIAVAARAAGRRRPAALGVVSGTLFGAMSALTKSTVSLLSTDVVTFLTAWEPYALLACAVGGLLAQQVAYQSGGIALSLPAIIVTEPVVASALGIGVLGESIRVSGAGWALIGGCCAAMLCGLVALARAEAELVQESEGSPSAAGSREPRST